jgi:hypothetical protein
MNEHSSTLTLTLVILHCLKPDVNFKNGYGKDDYFYNSSRVMHQTITGLSLHRARFNPWPVYVGSVADKPAMGQASL